jgi:hypothetical protein
MLSTSTYENFNINTMIVFLKKKKKRKNEERETSGDTFQHYIIIHINLIAAPVYLFHKDVTR